jgi:DNA-binding beta-propeller fold protein YncE
MLTRSSSSVLALALLAAAFSSRADTPARHVLDVIKVGGPDGWDYTTYDPATRTVYIAHGSAIATVNVLSKSANPHLADAQGAHIAYPYANGSMLLITHGRADQVTLNDAKSGTVKATIAVDAHPDAAIVDTRTERGFVMAGGAALVDVIDLKTNAVLARIPAGGPPEAAAIDEHGIVFTHLEDKHSLVVIDGPAMKLRATYVLDGCEEPSGIAYISGKDLVLSACGNQIARLTDARTGKEVLSLPIGKRPDSAFYDEQHRLGYVPCGDGTLTVIDFSAQTPKVAEVVTTKAGARTGAVDPATGFAYLPTAELGPPQKAGGRPSIVPDTFQVLVVGR